MRKMLLLLVLSGLSLWADSIPVLNATAFDAHITQSSFGYSASSDSFSLTGGESISGSSIFPTNFPVQVYEDGDFGGSQAAGPTNTVTGNVIIDGQTIFARYYGPGGRIIPSDAANYMLTPIPGTYSFAATVQGSLVACELLPGVDFQGCSANAVYRLPIPDGSGLYINIDLTGTETVQVTTALPGYYSFQISFASDPVQATPTPEPSSAGLLALGMVGTALGALYRSRLGPKSFFAKCS